MKKITRIYCVQKLFILLLLIPTIISASDYRLSVIHSLIRQYKRPITIACIGTEAILPKRISRNPGSTLVIINPDSDGQLEQLYRMQRPYETVLLKKCIALAELQRLGDCEHFDVVIACNIFSQFPATWQHAVRATINLGDHIFIESSTSEHSDFLERSEGKLVASANDQKLYLISKPKDKLTRRSWDAYPNQHTYNVQSDFHKKFFKKHKQGICKTTTPWIAGINLLTFKELNGAYPTYTMLKALFKSLDKLKHNDLAIFNLIIQGNKIVPIDGDEPGRRKKLKKGIKQIKEAFKKR